MRRFMLWCLGAVVVCGIGGIAIANLRLPYGDHIVIATDLVDHGFPYYRSLSRELLRFRKEPNCRFTGTFGEIKASRENGRLQFLIAAWERESSDGWSREIDRKLLLELLDEAVEECDPNSFSRELGPFRPLVYAILLRDTDLLGRLLARGADPRLRIEQTGKKVDGLTAIDFAHLIEKSPKLPNDVTTMRRMVEIMQQRTADKNG